MNHKAKRILTLIMLAALVMSLPVISASAANLEFDTSGTDPDVPPLCIGPNTTLSFIVGPNTTDAEYFKDIKGAKVQVDLYKVADAVHEAKGENHGATYVFDTTSYTTFGLSGLDTYEKLSALDNDAWRAKAQAAAQAMFAGSLPTPIVLDATEDGVTASATVSPGLYLVIAHGSDLTDPADYVETVDGTLTTIANSALYKYSYYPELLALPTTTGTMGVEIAGTTTTDPTVEFGYIDTEGKRQTEVSTAGGNWQTALTAMLKPVREYRFGDLYITKEVLNWDKRSPVTFVFEISASWMEKGVQKNYHNFVTLSFTSATKEYYAILQKFPVGTNVTVKEVYSGLSYSISGTAQEQTIEIPAPVKTTEENPGGDMTAAGIAEYKNTYNYGEHTGYGIENEFTSNGEDWVIRKIETPWEGDSES